MNYETLCTMTGGMVAQSQLLGREFPFKMQSIEKTSWV